MGITASSLRKDIARWLSMRLEYMYPRHEVRVYETSREKLSGFLKRNGLLGSFSASEAFDIHVHLTGILRRGDHADLVLVGCKRGPITLGDVGPMQAYSALALPALSLLVSPAGISGQLNLLLRGYNRVDLLEYAPARRLKVATWDMARKQIQPESVFPAGELG